MSILIVMCIGLFVGVIAKLLMPGRDPGGLIVTMLLGIGGALVASYLGRAVGWYGEGQTAGFIMAIFGAMALLLVYRLFRGSQHSGTPTVRS
jgi:uncharacterized membrane protein YeaQ/YmgE (transglycosylase-associated protein family)